MKFKEGDKVRILRQSHGWGSVRKGDIGIIRSIGADYINNRQVYTLNVDGKASGWSVYEECLQGLELTPEEVKLNEEINSFSF